MPAARSIVGKRANEWRENAGPFASAEVRFAQDDRFVVRKERRTNAGPFDSAELRFAQDDKGFWLFGLRMGECFLDACLNQGRHDGVGGAVGMDAIAA